MPAVSSRSYAASAAYSSSTDETSTRGISAGASARVKATERHEMRSASGRSSLFGFDFTRAVYRVAVQRFDRLSHRLVKFVSISNGTAYASDGSLVKNQDHECFVWNPFPLTGEAVA